MTSPATVARFQALRRAVALAPNRLEREAARAVLETAAFLQARREHAAKLQALRSPFAR